MFVDEQTSSTLSAEGNVPDDRGYIGLWKIVVVRNLPYNWKEIRYCLTVSCGLLPDPTKMIEYFLWRSGSEYAISNHYTRHWVWVEVIQNKRLNKYDHTAIDEQFDFYGSDGLVKFNQSDPDIPLPSCWSPPSLFPCASVTMAMDDIINLDFVYSADVPEGSFIVRAHTPMWLNEVDRFTSRDQLSFAYTYLKLQRSNPDKPFHLVMFEDCVRRALVKLFHHREL